MNGELCVGGSQCVLGKCACPSGVTVDGKPCNTKTARSKRSLLEQQVVVQRGRDDRVRRPQAGIQRCPTDGSCQLPDCYCSRWVFFLTLFQHYNFL